MTTSRPTAQGADAAPEQPRPSGEGGTRRRLLWLAAAVFSIGSFAVWIYMLVIYDPGLLVDELPDPTFGQEAEAVCAGTMDTIDALPRAEASDDPLERAEVVDVANSALAQMVAELRTLAPSTPPSSVEAVQEWLDDWDGHVEDRERYADALRQDPDARFTESTKADKQISRAIDGFAQVNRMPSCETPGDVG